MSFFPTEAGIWERRLLIALLAAFVAVGMLYNAASPIFEASDELWHYHFVRHLALGNPLPVQDAANQGPWRQEGSQPPLYYALAALATAWVDTSNIDEVARFNPHGNFGVISPDGNVNLVVHNREAEAWPWRGTALAVHVARLLSILMSAGTVYLTYRIGLELFPDRRWLALGGAAAVAFLPMFVFISASVNNDNAAILFSTLALWLMLRLVRGVDTEGPTLRRAIVLGVVLGLAALSKVSTLGLFGLAGLTMAYVAYRRRRWQTFFVEGPLLVVMAAALSGWWYLRNWRLYGDPLGFSAFLDIAGRRAPTEAPLSRLWAERTGFMWSYWGLFGGVGVPMATWTYRVLNGLVILSLMGIVVFLIRRARGDGGASVSWALILLSGLWPLFVATSLTRWANLTLASQGRLVFAAIAPLQLWFVAGLAGNLPEHMGKVVTRTLTAFLLGLTVAAPFVWIRPVYAPPERIATVPDGEVAAFHAPDESRPTMRLLDYEIATNSVSPGDWLEVTLTWQSESATSVDWSVFVHVTNEEEIIVAQRDTYPGQGTLATSDLVPGFAWRDQTVIRLPVTAYTPDAVTVYTGLYNLQTGERMTIGEGDETLVALSEVAILPPETGDDIPNPISFNLGNRMRLVGYDMSARSLSPGETLTVELYWRGIQSMKTDYTVFTHIIGPDTSIWGQRDSQPKGGGAPTTTWLVDELVKDSYELTLNEATPPGVYNLEIGAYAPNEEGEITRLEHITDDGRRAADFILLSPVRVTP